MLKPLVDLRKFEDIQTFFKNRLVFDARLSNHIWQRHTLGARDMASSCFWITCSLQLLLKIIVSYSELGIPMVRYRWTDLQDEHPACWSNSYSSRGSEKMHLRCSSCSRTDCLLSDRWSGRRSSRRGSCRSVRPSSFLGWHFCCHFRLDAQRSSKHWSPR